MHSVMQERVTHLSDYHLNIFATVYDRRILISAGLAGEGFANLEAAEAADDDVLAQFRDLRIEEIVDGLGVVLDEGLLKQTDGAVIFIEFSGDDFLDDGGGFALNLAGGDFPFGGDQ